MVDFRNCLIQIGMFDLRFRGPFHTWTNNRHAGPITDKLDRLLLNHSWLNAHPNSVATFSAPEFSDHSPCTLDLACPLPSAGTKPFRFFNYLTRHPSFCQVVETGWHDSGDYAWDLCSLYFKLKTIKSSLKTLKTIQRFKRELLNIPSY